MLGKVKFFKEISSSVFAMGCKTLVGFISIPLFISHLGTDRYGLWMVAISTLTFINFLDAGVFPTIKNRLTEYHSINDSGKYHLYLYSGFIFGAFLIILALVLSLVFVIIDINSFFKITDPIAKSESLPLFIVLYIIMVISISLSNVENYYASKILLSRIRFYEGILTIIMFGVTYLVLIYFNNLVLVAFLFASPIFILRTILFFNLIYKNNIIRSPLKEVITIIKLEIKPSISFLGIKFSEIIITMIPNFYIARQFNLKEVTHYNIVFKFISIPLILISAILPSIWPMLTLAWHKGNKVWIKKIINLSLLVTCIVFLVYLILAAFFGVDIIYLLTAKAVKSNYIFILLLGLLSFVMGIVYWVSTFLHSISDFKFEFILHIILAISISLLGGFAIKFYGLNSFIFIMIISWLFIAFVPMYKRTMNFLKNLQ
jgi:O-antigen/teichoic acid export membrane protein